MFQPADFKQTHQSRILIDRRMALGDVIMITPVVREFRKRYPEAFIQVVTEKPEVLANNPAVDATSKPTEMKAEDPWDVYVNLNDAYETNVTSHYVDSMIYRAFGEDNGHIDRSLSVYETDEERSYWTHIGKVVIPDEIAGIVDAVLGLDNFVQLKHALTFDTAPATTIDPNLLSNPTPVNLATRSEEHTSELQSH